MSETTQAEIQDWIALTDIPIPCGFFTITDGITLYNKMFGAFIERSQLTVGEIEQRIFQQTLDAGIDDGASARAGLIDNEHYRLSLLKNPDSENGYIFFIQLSGTLQDLPNTALILFFLDNYDEVQKSTSIQQQPAVIAEMDNTIYKWCSDYGVFVKKYSEDRYFGIINECNLTVCKKNRFDILEKIKEVAKGNKTAPTLSIGVGIGYSSAKVLGQDAEKSLEMAITRGGDQAVIKEDDTIRYYGAKLNLNRKRNKVKARLAAIKIQEAIQGSEQVFIIGHKGPDLDSFGASVAASVLCNLNNKTVKIVIDPDDVWISRLSNKLIPASAMKNLFTTPEEAVAEAGEGTLLIVVDTNRPNLVFEPHLLEKVGSLLVIDHHRIVDAAIENVDFLYVDPYASSTSELIAELYQYYKTPVVLDEWIATLMLAGIALDTKNFTIHTGAETFEAAAYLRREGADPLLVRDMMRDDLATFLLRAEIMHNIEIVKDNIALGMYNELIDNASELAAQTADQMLNIREVEASFVLCRYPEGIWISARSLGRINVQNILEKLGGGGHMMGAGAQLQDTGIDEARERLMQVIDDYLTRRD